jgi:hypothetical protein
MMATMATELIRDTHKLEQRAIQKEQQTDRMEDYLEVIYELINKKDMLRK